MYKVLSRALNNRLKKIREHIFSRGQKGFTNGRYIQEVLINVIEMIAHCRYNNIPGVIVSIDQAKAFDTVSHKFMHEVYKFFGLGPNFIKVLETLGNNRTTCIAFEDGSHSKPIKLGRGRAQGNTSSPIEYNMAEQIVIFKIELCPEIASVYVSHTIARPYLYLPENVEPLQLLEDDAGDPRYRNESNFETSKTDRFADDNSTGTLCEFRSLSKLKQVLSDFALISGLKCNTDKSVIMQIGNKIPISQEIIELGFAFDDKIKILGMEIDSELENLDVNFSNAMISIKKSINFWEKFNLSLQGRINIAKSLLFSQIIYLGLILLPSRQRINDLQNNLDNFKGNLNFAKNRITLPTVDGGLGMFNVEEFLTAQQCVWVLRAHSSTRDNWRVRLKQLCNGIVLIAGPNIIDRIANPILHGLS